MQSQLEKWPGRDSNPELSNCLWTLWRWCLARGKEQTLTVVTEHP